MLIREKYFYTDRMHDENMDEISGIVKSVRCGHRLAGEEESPFCSLFQERTGKSNFKWVCLTADNG